MSHRDDAPAQESAGQSTVQSNGRDAGQSRRGFLRSTALAGAGAAAGGAGAAVLGATPASAAEGAEATGSTRTGTWRPDTDALRFTLAVMPDTQVLYWGSQDSVNGPRRRRRSATSSRTAGTRTATTSCSWRTSAT